MNFNELKKFLEEIMDIRQANYQPVFIITLLRSNGTASKEKIAQSLKDYNPDKERNFKAIVDEIYHDVLGEPGTHKIVKQNENTQDFTLKLDEKLDETKLGILESICVNKINEYKNVQSQNEVQYFLIQVSEFGSTNLLKNKYYDHVDWQQTPRDRAHGAVKVGDLIVVYFARRAIDFEQSIKMIYRVESITRDNVQFNLSVWRELKGIPLSNVRESIEKGVLNAVFNKIGEQGFNIIKITKSDFDFILSLDGGIIVNDEEFKIAHKMFEDFILKNSGIQFTDFNNPYLLKQEIDYKRKIVEKTANLRIQQNWDEWKKTPGIILEELKRSCSPSICKNLIMGTNYGIEGSSAAALYLAKPEQIQNLERTLYDFFLAGMESEKEFAKAFNELIDYLKKNDLKVDWRFLAYLSFLANPTLYFPIQPTRFEKLIQYYGNNVKFRATFSWELYSSLLQLAEILKSKLTKYGKLDAIQVQSYMWVVSHLIEGGVGLTNYWVISPGEDAKNWTESKEKGLISVNWLANENLTGVIESNLQKKLTGKKFIQMRDFLYNIREGDFIIANKGQDEILSVGVVKGPYKYRSDLNYPHTIPVEWNFDKTGKIPRQTSWYTTVKPISKSDFDKLMSYLEESSDLVPPEFEEYRDILLKKKQIIFYGPPGTGKTYTANNFVKWFLSINTKRASSEKTQYMTDDQFNQYVIDEIRRFAESKNYDFVKELGTVNLYSLKNPHNDIRIAFAFSKSNKENPEEVYLGVSDKMIDFLEQVPLENQFLVIVNNDAKNFVMLPYEIEQKYARFVSGQESGKWDNTGKRQHAFRITISNNETKMLTREGSYFEKYYNCNQYLGKLSTLGIGEDDELSEFTRRVTFHPSYSYEEFVEGIKPKSREDRVEYPIEDGIFKIICTDARNDPNNNYVLIIDEINRGNISKIFGELITLIEKDKRNAFPLLLTYSKKHFTVPDNLYIIGTMNTADRSLTQLDTAIRRRFAFCELLPNVKLLDKTIEGIDVGKLVAKLNEKIRNEGLREKQIGHSYFMEGDKCIETLDELRFVFANEIIPLLQEYFYEDYDKLEKILGPKFVDEKEMTIKEDWKKDDTVFLEALKPFVSI